MSASDLASFSSTQPVQANSLSPCRSKVLSGNANQPHRLEMVHYKLAISPRAVLKSTAGRVLLCTAIVWLFAFFYCKHTLWRDPHSAFFDDSAVYDLHYSHERQVEANGFLAKAEANSVQHQSSADPVICAGIATVKRDEVQYLNGTLGSLLVGLTPEERSALNVRLLFASADPSAHPNWDDQWLKVLDHWSGYNVSEQELDDLRKMEEEKKYGQKGVRYVHFNDRR